MLANQIERLKNHAHDVQAILGQFFAREFGQIAILDDHAARGRTIKPCNQIQHRRLAGAGAPEQRDEFSAANFERNAVDRANHRFAHAVVPAEIFAADRDRAADGRSLRERSSWHLAHLSSQHAQSVGRLHVAILAACAIAVHRDRIAFAGSEE